MKYNEKEKTITTNKTEIDILISKGWKVSMHTDYYTNKIGFELADYKIGFHNYIDDLTFWVNGNEANIDSQFKLDRAINLVQAFVDFYK